MIPLKLTFHHRTLSEHTAPPIMVNVSPALIVVMIVLSPTCADGLSGCVFRLLGLPGVTRAVMPIDIRDAKWKPAQSGVEVITGTSVGGEFVAGAPAVSVK